MKSPSHSPLVLLALPVVLSLAACSAGGGAGNGADTGSADGPSAAAREALEQAYTGVGLDLADLPPVEVPEGVDLTVLACGMSIPACALPAEEGVSVAERIGWTGSTADGQLNPTGFATAIRQAVAAGTDVIVPIGPDCSFAQAAYEEAKDAGVTVVSGGGLDDCDPSAWAAGRLWLPDTEPKDEFLTAGELQAEYAFGKTDGDVHAIVLNFTSQVWGPWITEGFTTKLDELGGEIVDTIDISNADTVDGSFIPKVTTALLEHPEATVLVAAIDDWFVGGLGAAIVQSGLDDQLLVIGRGGEAPAIDLIRQGGGGLDATVGFAGTWAVWGSIDTAIRVLAGQDPQYVGYSYQVVDADRNLPDSGGYDGSVDYRSIYLDRWGVE